MAAAFFRTTARRFAASLIHSRQPLSSNVSARAPTILATAATVTAFAFSHGSSSHCASGPLAGQTVLVTGSNRGLGLEFVTQLQQQGANVIATCRTPANAQALKELGVQIEALDTSDIASVQALAARLEASGVVIDMLINNAGISSKNHPVDPVVNADPEDMLRVLNTNVVGTVQTTNALRPLMAASTRRVIVNLSSDLGSIHGTFTAQSTKVQPGGACSYRCSKAAGNMVSRVFAAELKAEGTIVIAMSPGWVETDMGNGGGRKAPLKPFESISGMLNVISGLTLEDTGKYYKYNGDQLPW